MIVGESKKGKRFIIATPTKCGTTSLEALAHRVERRVREPSLRIMTWDSPRRQHRMALPPSEYAHTKFSAGEWGDARRYLVVRNPYKRYMSVYEYLKAPANYSQWGAAQIQGRAWGGHNLEKMVDRDPMTFGEFLLWLADQRERPDYGTFGSRRDPITVGRAYRSPWVWTDPLDFSLRALNAQPGGGKLVLMPMEKIWGPGGELEKLVDRFGLGHEVEDAALRPPHSNRSRASSTPPRDYWGEWPHSRRVFNAVGEFRPFRGQFVSGCDCPPCRIEVFNESVALGYA